MGVDAGTSGCKAVIVDERCHVLASAWRSYPTRRSGAEVTQDANDWLGAVAATVRDCVTAAQGRHVAGLGITAPAHNVVLVDAKGQPLERVLLWSDKRCLATARELATTFGPWLFDRTFVELGPGWSLPQLAWLYRTRPRWWGQVTTVLPGKDFIRLHLTGRVATDPTDAAGSAMYDQIRGTWLPDTIEAAGLRPDAMPPVMGSVELAGCLTKEWARRTGLLAGTPVCIGATDTAAELVALGADAPGASLVKVGSTGTVVVVSSDPRPDALTLTYPHPRPGLWYCLAVTNTATTAYDWLQQVIFEASPEPATVYERMDRLALTAPAGSSGVLFVPFLEGERAPFTGRQPEAAFVGLTSAHGREHLCRAVLEGVAFSLRACRDLLLELDLAVSRPALGGGGVRSALWREILVSALGQDATLPEPQGPALGSAMLAAEATGQALVARDITHQVVTPRAEWQKTYDATYPLYRHAVDSVRAMPGPSSQESDANLRTNPL
jgi:xylulokinase